MARTAFRRGGIGLIALGIACVPGLPALAQPAQAPDWPTEKCNRYKAAYEQILNRQGKAGLGEDFLARHAAFLAANCQSRAEVCARSREEIALADKLTLMAMNRGMSGTFLPFYCRG